MKKIVCLLLTLALLLGSVSAMAAGKLNVVQENFHYVTSYWNYGYCYAKVENTGDRAIKVNAGVLEMYDADGEVITSADYVEAYAEYLQPGEYTYVEMYAEVEEGAAAPADHMMTLTGKSDASEVAVRLPVTTELQLGVMDGWWEYDYMVATVTNNTAEIAYEVEVVLALLDAEGNILYIDDKALYDEIGIMPGSSVVIRMDISSSFMEYFEANGLTPASVDAIAYMMVDAE